jgi:hypothetical protein
LPVEPGLIYAGLAGATRWPSGKRSTTPCGPPLAGMHLGGPTEFSTFRRTLAALLRGPLSLTSEDDPRLSAWISDHLQVTPVVVENADTLGRLEESVLQRLDPPLNLQGMTPTPLGARIRGQGPPRVGMYAAHPGACAAVEVGSRRSRAMTAAMSGEGALICADASRCFPSSPGVDRPHVP